ncbi:hypothetical protein LTR84_005803 [Exophiala bonariae]|uniref:Aldehyde dehydrogenase domain-containing protein n=1 Tax=Exophiala bonariae TaxID=1690606 RepID=A0AAV9N471_9EURO|nr:hypothetical protein LTR84_005803 [Exophiala bonariae]
MATNGVPEARFGSSSTIPLWLDGKEITSNSTFEVTSPVTHEVLYSASSASEEDVHKAVDSAQRAFNTWSLTKPRERRDIFLKAAKEFERRRPELKTYIYNETGEASAFFEFEYTGAIETCISIAGLIQVASESAAPTVNDGSAILLKEPWGVVLAISPWNAPYALGIRAVLSPLAMGNTVIFKGPEAAPATAWAITDVLHSAGLPAGCLNTVYHRPSDAAAITSALIVHPAIKKINFTGSTRVGSIIASLAGKNLKPTVLELGGKAPAIICEDADIEKAAFQCTLGAFLHAGQICMSTERILVNSKVLPQFRQAFKEAINTVFSEQGQGVAGQLFSKLPVENNKKLVADAISKGATTLYGDPNYNEPSETKMRPLVLESVKPTMDIYYNESFGPSSSLIVTQSDEEAVAIANDTVYGLSAAVFTENLRRGLRIARRLESGAVHINSMTVHDESSVAHGGYKHSGFGRFNGLDGLNEWVHTKSIFWKD